MASVHDLFTFYLNAEHLKGQTRQAYIESVTVEELWSANLRKKVPALVVRFAGKKLVLACNKTQAGALMKITGTDDFEKWAGWSVLLKPVQAPNGKQTILVLPGPAPEVTMSESTEQQETTS